MTVSLITPNCHTERLPAAGNPDEQKVEVLSNLLNR